MSLRARLTLLFLAAVQVTFLSAVAAYWAVQSWRLLTDDLILVPEQIARLERVLEAASVPPAGDATAPSPSADAGKAIEILRRHVQTRDEARGVDVLAAALAQGSEEGVRTAARRLRAYYHDDLQALRRRSDFLVRLSQALVAGIILIVIASFVGFLAAIRSWLVEPVRAIERATEIMSTGDLGHRIELSGADELGRLGASINGMADSLSRIQGELVARERFALLGEMSAYVAHNIRNPLASIRATAQAELVDLGPDDPRRGVFQDIVSAADRLAAWVTDLLRSASPVVLERQEGRLGEVVAHCAEMARPRLSAAGVEMTVDVEPTPAVSFDQAKLEQVVSAVLANAIEASPPHGRIRMSVASDTETVIVRVADEGAGVPFPRRSRLFAPFSTTKPAGTGIGLWLSQKIVTAHGGSISLQDGEERGTTVEIRLPTG
jgi:signal transduction histidine kinase